MIHISSVSIIIAAYNHSSELEITLRSLLRQDFTNPWEIVICDDGSSENLLKIIDSVLGIKVPYRYIKQSRAGERRARSRNNGIKCAVGSIIILLDADIVVPSNFISRHVAEHHSSGTLVCGTRKWLFLGDIPVDDNVETHIEDALQGKIQDLHSEDKFQKKHVSSSAPWISCLASNMSFVVPNERILFDEQFVGWGIEDQEFSLRLMRDYKYKLIFVDNLYGIHLEKSNRTKFHPIRPSTPSEASQYIKNLIYFDSLYPELKMSPIYKGLAFLELNVRTNEWQRCTSTDFSTQSIVNKLQLARTWIGSM